MKQMINFKSVANLVSQLFFCSAIPWFIKGWKCEFAESDLPTPKKNHQAATLGDHFEDLWNSEQRLHEQPSLWRPIMKMFAKECLQYGIIISLNEFLLKLSQPILIWKLMENFETQPYIYASLLILTILLNALSFQWGIFNLRDLGMKMKVACSSLIYRKSLRLNKKSVSQNGSGHIVNLLSNDISRFDRLLHQIHFIWVAPLQAVVICILLYFILDASGSVGVAFYFLFLPLQIYLGRKYSDYRSRTAVRSDERIRLVNEIITGIQMIKMYTWEELFIQLGNHARRREVKYIQKTTYLKALQSALSKYLTRGAIFLCILVYVFSGNKLQPQYVFVIKSFYILLKESMTNNFPDAIKNLAEVIVSVRRIQQFLLYEETSPSVFNADNHNATRITLQGASARWLPTGSDVLADINFSAAEGVVAVIGSVGSGKSSLISAILQELPLREGKLEVNGRVAYAPQDPWLFAGTIKENILFGAPFSDRYSEVVKVCALDRDFELLPHGESSVVGDRGVMLSGGQKARINLARAIYHNADIYLLDDPLAAVDASVAKQIFNDCILNYLQKKCVVLVTHQLQFLDQVNSIYLMKNGRITNKGNCEEIQKSGATLLKGNQMNDVGDFLDLDDVSTKSQQVYSEAETSEYKNQGVISAKVYREYLLSGGYLAFGGIILAITISQALQSGSDYFEAYWVNLAETPEEGFISLDDCLYVYAGLMVLILLSTITAALLFFVYFTSASIRLHNRMFSAIIRTSIKFFYSRPSGTILNRFSKDMGTADINIPKYLMDTVDIGFNVVAIILLISIVNPVMLVAALAMLAIFYLLREIYLRTSREMKRIEATTYSPIFSLLNESLHGLETIRAFGVQHRLRHGFDNQQNRNMSAFHLLNASSAAFGFWLDVICLVYIALVAFTSIWANASGAEIGLVITQAMGLTTMFGWGMKQWSEFENEMISVERIIEFTEVEPEATDKKNCKTLPKLYSVEFNGVSLKYNDETALVLNSVNFEIAPKEKIGIVGRTGAGKSSIISALFRLVDYEGVVKIDGIDIRDLPLKELRSRISIIPQEPVLFHGSIRLNLDPFRRFSDSKIWAVLDELDLKAFVAGLPLGLQSDVSGKGANLSGGQRQLFCLARALLQKNKLLVLDEATASVDVKTDTLIQSTIKRNFHDCTVLIIAHRLNTIMECDKVLVMDAGRVLEFDHPHKLLQKENGALRGLALKTGSGMTRYLEDVALKNFENQ